jgi:2,3-bisphosphoglycerate-independent phosphoglycerate mutase
MAGTGVKTDGQQNYSENSAKASGLKIERGHELMEYFLRGATT